MTELQFITDTKAILDVDINAYVIEIISRKKASASEMMVIAAIICKEGLVTPNLLANLIDYAIQNNDEIELTETAKDMQDLKSEVIFVQAKIQYLKGN